MKKISIVNLQKRKHRFKVLNDSKSFIDYSDEY